MMAAKASRRPLAYGRTVSPELEFPRWRKDVKILKGFFWSFLWKYPVRAFIGEVVKGQQSTIECIMYIVHIILFEAC